MTTAQHEFKLPGRLTIRERLARWWMLRKMTIEQRAARLEMEELINTALIDSAAKPYIILDSGEVITDISRESDTDGVYTVQ